MNTRPGTPSGPQIGRIRGQLEDIHTLLGAYWASGDVVEGGDGPLELAAASVNSASRRLESPTQHHQQTEGGIMPQVGFQYGPRQLTFAEAEVLSQKGEFSYPVPLIRAIAEQRESDVPSASVIAGCLRQFELKKRVDYFSRPTSSLPSLFGTAWHTLMEGYTEVGNGAHKELRLSTAFEIDGTPYVFQGQLDYLKEGEVLRDWKSKAYIPQGFVPPRNHKAQVNSYNVLAEANGYKPATRWELVYVSQSWLSAFSEPMASLTATREWIQRRLTTWARSSAGGNLPEPLPEVFAVDEKTNKGVAPCVYCEVREQCLAALKDTYAPLEWEEAHGESDV